MSERVYAAAARVELTEWGIPFESEKTCAVHYRSQLLCHQRVDLFVVSYLRLTGARVGLLVNFNVPMLKQGIRRVVV
jgi:hypothetical protein